MKNYAVILKFDKKSEAKIQKLINKINEKRQTLFSIPPHITLGVFQTDKLNEYTNHFFDYANELINGEVTFSSIGQFVPKVLYLAPVMNDVLLHNHEVISQMIYSSNSSSNIPKNANYYHKGESGNHIAHLQWN